MGDRFFCPDRPAEGRVRLDGDEAHHLARVRRLEPGDEVELEIERIGRLRSVVA